MGLPAVTCNDCDQQTLFNYGVQGEEYCSNMLCPSNNGVDETVMGGSDDPSD